MIQGQTSGPRLFGSDYDETFFPVVRQESVRTLVATSVQHGLQLHQVDITTAFLNGELEEEVYMCQPEGFITSGSEDLVCRLKKSTEAVLQVLEHCTGQLPEGNGFFPVK